MIRVLRITTVQESLESLLKGQLRFFKNQGYDLAMASAITAPDRIDALEQQEECKHYSLPLTRKITPFRDVVAIWKTYWLIRKLKPVIVHTHTPKAGMVGMIAAWLARVPIRLHTVAGLPLMEKKGIVKKILVSVEQITYTFATRIYPNSFGLKEYIFQNISKNAKIKVIGKGSSNGINISYFSESPEIAEKAQEIQNKLNIDKNDYIWVFVGRVVGDKGINELVEAFNIFQKEYPNNSLLIVGPYEKDLDPLKEQTEKLLETHGKIYHAGFQKDIRPYLYLSDSLAFPSYREGFPNVPMQAACMGLSLILTDINGCNEIIQHEESGLLIAPKSIDAIINAMKRLYLSKEFAKQLAIESQNEIRENYGQTIVWNQILLEYQSLLQNRKNGGKQPATMIYKLFIKRLIDVFISLVCMVVLSPILLIVMFCLSVANHGKPFFIQERPGKHEKLFNIIKFKTMNDKRDSKGDLLSDEQRLTQIGKSIRKTSLDELPQLINVLKGDMSLIGPRPLLIQYLPLYNQVQKRRHNVKPGITGWAQVNGRNAISWEQKFEYDVWYVDNLSFGLDIKILYLTILKVLKSEGISQEGSVTAESFKGNTKP